MTTPGSPNEFSRPDDLPTNSVPPGCPAKPVLAENIFLDDEATASDVARTPLPVAATSVVTSPPLPGPGLPEALLWVFGCFAAHIVGFVVMAVFALVMTAVSTGQAPDQSDFEQVLKEQMLLLTGGEQLMFVLFAMLAIFVRFGRNRASQLGLRAPRIGHAVLVVALMFPVAFISGHCFHVATQAWQTGLKRMDDLMAPPAADSFANDEEISSLTHAPVDDVTPRAVVAESTFWQLVRQWWQPFREFLRGLDENQTMDVLKDMSGAPLPLLLIIIAVAPALGEELMFRGLIGRGLVARWGIIRGILLTSLLFGIVHLHPAHALAVIPLGIAMHFVYLTTRSFWAPVLLHFLNNAWATVVTKYAHELEGAELMSENVGLPTPVLVQSLVLIVAIGMLLWHTRVRFVLPTGEHWSPQYATVELPPSHVPASPNITPPTRLLLLHCAGSLFAFGVILWQSA